MKSKIINVLLADDHTIFLEGISSLFLAEDNINIAGTVQNGKEALEFLDQYPVDIVLSDISMPGMDGIELSRVIQKKYPLVKTIILTTYSDPEMINKLMKNNIRGYLLKNVGREELTEAIRKVMAGENYYSESVKESYMNMFFNGNPSRVTQQTLSKREIEIIRYIAKEYTTEEIADKLILSQHTVKTHRKNILAKLGLKNTAGLVRYAIQKGLAD